MDLMDEAGDAIPQAVIPPEPTATHEIADESAFVDVIRALLIAYPEGSSGSIGADISSWVRNAATQVQKEKTQPREREVAVRLLSGKEEGSKAYKTIRRIAMYAQYAFMKAEDPSASPTKDQLKEVADNFLRMTRNDEEKNVISLSQLTGTLRNISNGYDQAIHAELGGGPSGSGSFDFSEVRSRVINPEEIPDTIGAVESILSSTQTSQA